MYRRKRLNKPWIEESVVSNNKSLRSKIVRVLCRSSNICYGAVVKVVTDGELKIVAAFTEEAVKLALSDLDSGGSPCWNTALLILHEYSIELRNIPGKDYGEFVLFVEKFNIWDLQPGYQAKYDFKFCMENERIWDRMMEVYAERRASKSNRLADTSNTGSVSLTQLLDEMTAPSSELHTSNDHSEQNLDTISDSLREKLLAPFTVQEFLIPEQDAASLDHIQEWKADYVPQSSLDDRVSSDMIHDTSCHTQSGQQHEDRVNPATITSGNQVKNKTTYLGIAVSSSPSSENENQQQVDNNKEAGPVDVLHNKQYDSISQDASQWQEGLDSVRFSFEGEDSLNSSEPTSPIISTSQIGVPAAHSTQRECTQKTSKQLEQPLCAQVLVLSNVSSMNPENVESSNSKNCTKYTEMEDNCNQVLSSQGDISQSSLTDSDKQVMADYYQADAPCDKFNTTEMRLRNREYSVLKKREKLKEALEKLKDTVVEVTSPTAPVQKNLDVCNDNEMDKTENKLCETSVRKRSISPRYRKVVSSGEDTNVNESAENVQIANTDVSNVNENVPGRVCSAIKDKVNTNKGCTSLQENEAQHSDICRDLRVILVKNALNKQLHESQVSEHAKGTNKHNETSSTLTQQNTDRTESNNLYNYLENRKNMNSNDDTVGNSVVAVSVGPVEDTVNTHEEHVKNSNESIETLYPNSTFSPRETPSDNSTPGIGTTQQPSQDSALVLENVEEIGKSPEPAEMVLHISAGSSSKTDCQTSSKTFNKGDCDSEVMESTNTERCGDIETVLNVVNLKRNDKECSQVRRSKRLENIGNNSAIKTGSSLATNTRKSLAIKHTELTSCVDNAESNTKKITRNSAKVTRTTAETVDQALKSKLKQQILQRRKSEVNTQNSPDNAVNDDKVVGERKSKRNAQNRPDNPVIGDTETRPVPVSMLKSGQIDADDGECQISVKEAKKNCKKQTEDMTSEQQVAVSTPTNAECDKKSPHVRNLDNKSPNRKKSVGKKLDSKYSTDKHCDKESENKGKSFGDNEPSNQLNKEPCKESVFEEGISGTQPFDVVHFQETLGFTPNLSADSMEVSDSSFNELFKIDKENDIQVKTSDCEVSTNVKGNTTGSKNLNKSDTQATEGSFTKILEKPLLVPENTEKLQNNDGGKVNLSESLSSSESVVFIELLHKQSKETDRKLRPDSSLNDSKDPLHKQSYKTDRKVDSDTKVNDSNEPLHRQSKRTDRKLNSDTKVDDSKDKPVVCSKERRSFSLKSMMGNKVPSVKRKRKLSVEKVDKLKKVKYTVAEAVEDCTKPDSGPGSDCVLIDDSDNVNADTENEHLLVKDKTLLKTYEPKKVFIDGNCFGNKNMWPNYIGNKVSGEVKQKQSRDRSNRKRLSCQSSQSSDSNEQHRNESKTPVGKTLTENRKSDTGLDGRGQLKYGQVNGEFRFFRIDENVTPTKNKKSETCDVKTPEGGDKTVCSKCKLNSPIVLCKKLTPRKLCAGTSELDKRSFVNDWLMKHKKISEPREPEGSQEWALNEHTSPDMPPLTNQTTDVLGNQQELSARNQPSLTAGKQPDKSARNQPSLTAGKQPDKSARNQPSLTAGKQPDKSARNQPSLTAGKQPDKSVRNQPSITAGKQPDKSARNQPSITAGKQANKSARNQPSITAGNQLEQSARNQLNKSEEDLFNFSDSSNKSPNHKSNPRPKMVNQMDPKSPTIPKLQKKTLSAADMYFKMFEMV